MGEYSKALAEEANQLKADLAEARAQIKEQAKDAYFIQQRLTEERDEARAQIAERDRMLDERDEVIAGQVGEIVNLDTVIAAKDAALRQIADAPAWGAPDKWETTPAEVRQLAHAALSHPATAQETE